MHGDPPRFAGGLREHDRFLAEHECSRAAKKMRGDDRAVRGDGLRTFDDGDGIAAGVSHLSPAVDSLYPPLEGEGRSPKASGVG